MWSQNMTIFPLLLLFAFTTACTTVQAVTHKVNNHLYWLATVAVADSLRKYRVATPVQKVGFTYWTYHPKTAPMQCSHAVRMFVAIYSTWSKYTQCTRTVYTGLVSDSKTSNCCTLCNVHFSTSRVMFTMMTGEPVVQGTVISCQ